MFIYSIAPFIAPDLKELLGTNSVVRTFFGSVRGIYKNIMSPIPSVVLVRHPGRSPWTVTLVGHPGQSPWSVTLVGHPGRSPWSATLVGHPGRLPWTVTPVTLVGHPRSPLSVSFSRTFRVIYLVLILDLIYTVLLFFSFCLI